MYAIIATGGKQYKVSEGDTVRVEKLGAEAGAKFTFDQVLYAETVKLEIQQLTELLLKQQLLAMVRLRKLSYTSTREKQVIIKRMVIDSSIQKLRLTRSMLNFRW